MLDVTLNCENVIYNVYLFIYIYINLFIVIDSFGVTAASAQISVGNRIFDS